MSVLPVGFGSSLGGYQIERSLRFNSADSAYLNRTPGSASNRKTWTWSGWVKRSQISAQNGLFSAGTSFGTNNNDLETISFPSGDTLEIASESSGITRYRLITTQVFRDASAWYHIIVAVDTTQATSTNRIKLYINGIQVTAFGTSTYPSQNYDCWTNSTNAHRIGSRVQIDLNGYLTEVNFIDGQALTPSSFGETDTNTGVWKPKAFSGTYGTNGFYLKFADNSGTTSTTLGKDSSGNANNWTPNNFSVTAGAGNDSLVDSPTSYGTDTGAGGEVRGNYCTLNPNDNGNSNILLTNGNLSVSSSTTWDRGVKGTFGVASGKWYYEYTHGTVNAGTNPAADIGWTKYPSLVNSASNGGSSSSDSYFCQGSNGNKYNAGSGSSYGSAFTTGDVEMCAIDLDNGKVYWGKNGTWFNSGDPAAGTNAAYTGLSGTFFPLWYWGISAGTSGVLISNINFGQRPFAYTAPSGFKALCTQNLPTPTIGATSTTQANDYMNVVLYNGNSSTQAITGVGFQPDLVWIKIRNLSGSHGLYDAVRGTTKRLYSDLTAAEGTVSGVTAFGSDGFTLGSDSSANGTSYTYVAWNWKANGAGSSNTAGTITSTVSANTTSGFSIVQWTGSGANGTVGHGLGVAPQFMFMKNKTNGGTGWPSYHAFMDATAPQNYYISLADTTAKTSASNAWNNTAPTSSVFSVGSSSFSNGGTMIAYVFAPVAGYSAFGSYTGNGSADGPFVYTGFRPRFVMVKSASNVTNWAIVDTARSTYNATLLRLRPNSSGAEDSYTTGVDIVSNGFKIKDSTSDWNDSGATYIYAAFAANPFKYSLGA